jgi:hypothetical protein
MPLAPPPIMNNWFYGARDELIDANIHHVEDLKAAGHAPGSAEIHNPPEYGDQKVVYFHPVSCEQSISFGFASGCRRVGGSKV